MEAAELKEYSDAIHKVAKEMSEAVTAADIIKIWKANLSLGHRALGRLLIGQDPEKLIERKA